MLSTPPNPNLVEDIPKPSKNDVDYERKSYFLTYARCPLSMETVRDALLHRGAKWFIVAEEPHKDGYPHIHAYIEFERKKRVRSSDYFDIGGYHPNIEKPKSNINVQKYTTKGGKYIANMQIVSGHRTYGEIISSCNSKDEFLVQVEKEKPRDLVLNLERLQFFANWKWGGQRELYTSPFQTWVVPQELGEWVDQNVINRDKDCKLILSNLIFPRCVAQ